MSATTAVAAAIASRRGELTISELHRLLYFCQGFALAWRGAPLFDEAILASREGPTLASIDGWRRPEVPPSGESLSADDEAVVDAVLGFFSDRGETWLRALAQRELPWRQARAPSTPRASTTAIIERHVLSSYFRSVAPTSDDLSAALKRGLDIMVETPLEEIDDLLSDEALASAELERWLNTSPASEAPRSDDCDEHSRGHISP